MAFILSLHHDRVIPTVNVGSDTSRSRMRVWTEKWTHLSKARARQGDMLVAPRSDAYW